MVSRSDSEEPYAHLPLRRQDEVYTQLPPFVIYKQESGLAFRVISREPREVNASRLQPSVLSTTFYEPALSP